MHLKHRLLSSAAAVVSVMLLCGCYAEIMPEEMEPVIPVTEAYITETIPFHETTSHITLEETGSLPTGVSKEEPSLKEPWYTTGRLIYHACGGIDGVSYSNSKEAMESTLAAGNTLVEVDFLFTTDDHLVCLHKWIDMLPVWKYKELKREYKDKEDQIPETQYTLDQFLNKKVKGKFTGLTAEDIISYMKENPDLYIVVDTKEEDLAAVIGNLLKLCDYQPDVADRFVIQLYDCGQKAQMLELYPFRNENFLFTCYKFDPLRVEEILALCDEEQIDVVTVSYGSWDAETVALFLEQNITLFEHTVNQPEMIGLSLEKGIYGFYTDFLQESELMGLTY